MTSPICLHPSDEDDLRWYYNQAAGDLGEKSPMGSMTDRLAEGRTHTQGVNIGVIHLTMVNRMDAAARARRVDARLRRLSRADQATLHALLGPGPTPGQSAAYAGLGTPAVPLALLLLTARRQHVETERLREWAKPAADPPAPDLPDDAPAETRQAAARAHKRDVTAARTAAAARLRAHLAPLRLAAGMAHDAAVVAYTATAPGAAGEVSP